MSIKNLIFNITFLLLVIFFVSGLGFFIVDKINILPVVAQGEEEVADKEPPKVFNIEINDVTATSSVITWETDELSDSLVNYGLDKNYGIVRDPHFDKYYHTIVLDTLMPDTEYYVRMTSSDSAGNQGISSDYSFVTKKIDTEKKEGYAEKVLDEGKGGVTEDVLKEGVAGSGDIYTQDKVSLQQVTEFIKQIKSEETLKKVEENIQKQAQDVILPPTIILDYADVEVGTDYAVISWATDKESNSIVSLVRDSDYDPNAEDPYAWSEGDADELVLEHKVEVNGLTPATIYHFQVSSKSVLDLTGVSSDKTFKTKSIKPEIYNIQITKVEEESATIRFLTNVPCSSIIEYTNLNTNAKKLEGNSSYVSAHSMKLTNLIFDTYYSAFIKVESEDGETAESDALTFITIRDEYPPEISKVNTESTLYPGSDNKIQTIASWRTDEPAKCQLFYHQGLVVADEANSLPIEEDYGIKHVQVVTNFAPSEVYKFWIICSDKADNKAKSDDFTMLTPSQEESIIDIIIKNFESSFSWVKNFNKN